MAETNQEKVMALIRAINAHDAGKAATYFNSQFVQHDAHMAPGIEGVREYVAGTPPEELKLRVARMLEDGSYVVVQSVSEASRENSFAVYRFQDGRIVEHWAFYSADAPPNQSGHTQLDGSTEPKHGEDTEKNKAFVRRYYETFHLAGSRDRNDVFFTCDVMIRHEPGVRDGLREFLRDVEILMKHRTIDEIKLLLGQGDLIFIVAKGTHEQEPCAYIDLYRVENEKIVEHWGFPQMAPHPTETKNENGIF